MTKDDESEGLGEPFIHLDSIDMMDIEAFVWPLFRGDAKHTHYVRFFSSQRLLLMLFGGCLRSFIWFFVACLKSNRMKLEGTAVHSVDLMSVKCIVQLIS